MEFDRKTSLSTSAKNVIRPVKEMRNILKIIPYVGRFYEPIAIQMYEHYMNYSS